MKTLIKILILSIIFYSCDKNDPVEVIEYHDDKLVEELTYDPYGVVFKITNDVNYINSDNESPDSLAFGKFHYFDYYETDIDALNNREYFTWIPYKHYVCWRYNYTGEKQIIIANTHEDGYFIYGNCKKYSCDPSEVDTAWFQEIFPYPVNDTVYVSINKLIEDRNGTP